MGGRTGTGQGTWRGCDIRRLRRRTREFGAAAAVVGEEVSAVEDERRGGRQHGDNTAVRAPSLTGRRETMLDSTASGRRLMRSSPSPSPSSPSSSPPPKAAERQPPGDAGDRMPGMQAKMARMMSSIGAPAGRRRGRREGFGVWRRGEERGERFGLVERKAGDVQSCSSCSP